MYTIIARAHSSINSILENGANSDLREIPQDRSVGDFISLGVQLRFTSRLIHVTS